MITVAIIEDNRLVREGMTEMLNDLPDVKVVLAGTTFDTALLKNANPRVVLLDIGLQDTNPLEVAETVRKELANSEVMTGTLFSQIAREAVKRGGEAALEAVHMTRREREVIALIADGMSNKQIAQDLNIASDTVKSHVRNAMEKLALHTRLQIAAYAHQQPE